MLQSPEPHFNRGRKVLSLDVSLHCRIKVRTSWCCECLVSIMVSKTQCHPALTKAWWCRESNDARNMSRCKESYTISSAINKTARCCNSIKGESTWLTPSILEPLQMACASLYLKSLKYLTGRRYNRSTFSQLKPSTFSVELRLVVKVRAGSLS